MFDLTNKKMLKEWQKIECADIFSTLEEFAKFYYENGEKNCFRILTNDPWSKDNFFFGTYQELRDYYNTEYPKRNIGKKFYSLTVLDVFKGDDNGKERWYARCICDCGKESIKLLDSLKSGNARTCGCKEGKGIGKEPSLYDYYSDIVDSYWDFEKNDIDPKDVPLSSLDEFWWKGYKESYKMPIFYLFDSETGTSFPEQTISFFIKQNGLDVINRHLINWNDKKYEVDIFIPRLNVAIEYDGVFWHSSKADKELEKNKVMEEAGITFIRIREKGLIATGIKKGTEININSSITNTSLAGAINKLFSYLESISSVKFDKINSNNIAENKINIKKQYSSIFNPNNIANHWLSQYWSSKNTVHPHLVPINSVDKYCFVCEQGAEFYYSPKYLLSKVHKNTNLFDSECIFRQFNICRRETVICTNIQAKIVNTTFFEDRYCAIEFIIENKNDTHMQPLEVCEFSVLSNNDIYSFGKNRSTLKSFETIPMEEQFNTKCATKTECLGKQIVELTPLSKKRYILTLELKKNQIIQDKFDIVAVVNLLDPANWVYKLCLNIQKVDNDAIIRSKTYTWESYNNIIRNKTKKLFDTLEQEEVCNLVYHIKTHTDFQSKKFLIEEKSEIGISYKNKNSSVNHEVSTESFEMQTPKHAFTDENLPLNKTMVNNKGYDETKLINKNNLSQKQEKTYCNYVHKNNYQNQNSKSTSQDNKIERKKIFISIAFVVAIILFIIFMGRSCSRNNNNTDLTNHKSVVFSLNNDDTYTMGRNLMKKTPDVIVIPEMYNDKPITIMDGNFSEYNITEVVGSSNLTKITSEVFADKSDISHMKLEKVVFPKEGNLESIDRWVFFNNDKLHTVVVPENFKSFGVGVFYSCDLLSTLVIYSETPPAGANGLFNDGYNKNFFNKPDVVFTVYVPDDAVEIYKQSSWGQYRIRPISEYESK